MMHGKLLVKQITKAIKGVYTQAQVGTYRVLELTNITGLNIDQHVSKNELDTYIAKGVEVITK